MKSVHVTQSWSSALFAQLHFDFKSHMAHFSRSFHPLTFSEKWSTSGAFYYLEHPDQAHEEVKVKEGKRVPAETKRPILADVGTIRVEISFIHRAKKVVIGEYGTQGAFLIVPQNSGMAKLFNFAANEIINWSSPLLSSNQMKFFADEEVWGAQTLLPYARQHLSLTKDLKACTAFDVFLPIVHLGDDPQPVAITLPATTARIVSAGSSDNLEVTFDQSLRMTIRVALEQETQEEGFAFCLTADELFVFRVKWEKPFKSREQVSRIGFPGYSTVKVETITSKRNVVVRNSLASSGSSLSFAHSKNVDVGLRIGDVKPIPGSSASYFYTLNKKAKGPGVFVLMSGRSWLPINEQSFEVVHFLS